MRGLWKVDASESTDAAEIMPTERFTVVRAIMTALRRRRGVWVLTTMLGLLSALLVLLWGPTDRIGSVSIFMTHPAGTDAASAMSTDVRLALSRPVAERSLDRLGWSMSPQEFQRSIKATGATSSILTITVSAPSVDAAQAAADAVSQIYLEFRAEQVRGAAQAQTAAHERSLQSLRERDNQLAAELSSIAGRPAEQARAADITAQRGALSTQAASLTSAILDLQIRANNVVLGSRIVDGPNVAPESALRRWVLYLITGLLAGLSIGIGLVLVGTILSDKPRWRREIADALGFPIAGSVGRLPQGRRATRRSLRSRGKGPRGGSTRRAWEHLGTLVEMLLSRQPVAAHSTERPIRLAVAGVANASEVRIAVAATGAALAATGAEVRYVDLTMAGGLDRVVALGSDPYAAAVYRPEGFAPLARYRAHGRNSGLDAMTGGSVLLTAADLDPSVGIEVLSTWADHLVCLLTAGAASTERLHAAGELVRSHRWSSVVVLLAGQEAADGSLGLPIGMTTVGDH